MKTDKTKPSFNGKLDDRVQVGLVKGQLSQQQR